MKQNKSILLIYFFLSSYILWSQTAQFQYQFKEGGPFIPFYRGVLQEDNGKIYAMSANYFFEITQDGVIQYVKSIIGVGDGGTFYLEKQDDGFLIGGLLATYYADFRTELLLLKVDQQLKLYSEDSFFISIERAAYKGKKGPSIAKIANKYFLMDEKNIYIIDSLKLERKINHTYRQPAGIIYDEDSNHVIVALAKALESGENMVAIDTSGNQLWAKKHPVISFLKMVETSRGIIALGKSAEGQVLLNMNKEGDIVWTKLLNIREASDVIPTAEGGYAVVGTDERRVQLLKLNSEGVLEWKQAYEEGFGNTLIQLAGGGYALLAYYKNGDDHYTYFIKTDTLGQVDQPIQRSNSQYGLMDINNIETIFSAKGTEFLDWEEIFSEDASYYEVPAKSGKSTMYAGGLWIGGKDESEELHIAAQTFSDGEDYQAGSISDSTGFYNNVWSIYKRDVRTFLRDLEDGHIDKTETVPYGVLYYPGLGNPFISDAKGQTYLIKEDFAPFVDINEDGIYNPMDGDYPQVKGDKMLVWIMNNNKKNKYTGLSLGVDIHCMVYGYDLPSDDVINNTLFFEASITNKSINDYHDLYLGQWINFDIGCLNQDGDFIGSNPVNDFFYAYHGDASDDGENDGVCQFGSAPYGTELPVQTVTLLNRKLTSVSFYSSALSQRNPFTTDLLRPKSFYNYLTGYWPDGLPMITQGIGHDFLRTIEGKNTTFFAFPDNPASGEGWSACTIGEDNQQLLVSPSVIGASGPHSLAVGETIKLAVAFTTFEDVPHPCPNIDPIATQIAELKQLYESGKLDKVVDSLAATAPRLFDKKEKEFLKAQENVSSYSSIIDGEIKDINLFIKDLDVSIRPNPFYNKLRMDMATAQSGITTIAITDVLGKQLFSSSHQLIKGNNQIELSFPNTLVEGVYFLTVSKPDENLKNTFKILHRK